MISLKWTIITIIVAYLIWNYNPLIKPHHDDYEGLLAIEKLNYVWSLINLNKTSIDWPPALAIVKIFWEVTYIKQISNQFDNKNQLKISTNIHQL
jgi:hypothetical protein